MGGRLVRMPAHAKPVALESQVSIIYWSLEMFYHLLRCSNIVAFVNTLKKRS